MQRRERSTGKKKEEENKYFEVALKKKDQIRSNRKVLLHIK